MWLDHSYVLKLCCFDPLRMTAAPMSDLPNISGRYDMGVTIFEGSEQHSFQCL